MASISNGAGTQLPKQHQILLSGLEDLFNTKLLTDVTLVADGQEFQCHRSVLAASSPYFRAMFTSDTLEQSQDTITLHNVQPCALGLIIEFIYTAEIKLTHENIQDVFTAASLLEMLHLGELCTKYMTQNMDGANCVDLYLLAEFHHSPPLKKATKKFIIENFDDIARSKVKDFLQLPGDVLVEILNSDELNVEHEETVARTIFDWIEHEFEERQIFFPQLLRSIRYIHLPVEFVEEYIHSNERITGKLRLFVNTLTALHTLYKTEEIAQSAQNACGDAFQKVDVGSVSCEDTEESPVRILKRRGMYNTDMLVFVAGSQKEEIRSLTCFDPVLKDNYCAIPPNVSFDYRYRLDYHKAVVTSTNDIYCIGGIFYPDHKFQGPALNKLKLYNIKKNKWIDKASMLVPRCAFAAILHNDEYIYVIGGKSTYPEGEVLDSIECYDIELDRWSIIKSLPVALYHHSAILLKNSLYIIGGIDKENNALGSVFMLDLDQEDFDWLELSSMRVPRAEFGTTVYQEKIVVMGGRTEDPQAHLSTVEIYDPVENAWKWGVELPENRKSPILLTFRSKLYLCGGVQVLWNRRNHANQDIDRKDLFLFDEESKQWVKVAKFVRYANPNACVVARMNVQDLKEAEFVSK